jgi:hypothetical protein
MSEVSLQRAGIRVVEHAVKSTIWPTMGCRTVLGSYAKLELHPLPRRVPWQNAGPAVREYIVQGEGLGV